MVLISVEGIKWRGWSLLLWTFCRGGLLWWNLIGSSFLPSAAALFSSGWKTFFCSFGVTSVAFPTLYCTPPWFLRSWQFTLSSQWFVSAFAADFIRRLESFFLLQSKAVFSALTVMPLVTGLYVKDRAIFVWPLQFWGLNVFGWTGFWSLTRKWQSQWLRVSSICARSWGFRFPQKGLWLWVCFKSVPE